MKAKDIALITFVGIISAVISLFASQSLLGSHKNRQQEVEVVQPISADFPLPDSRYFNNGAFDPAKTITIGQNTNNDPFNSSGH